MSIVNKMRIFYGFPSRIILIRRFASVTKEIETKPQDKPKKKTPTTKISKEIAQYMSSTPGMSKLINLIPGIFMKKTKSIENIHLINPQTAFILARAIGKHIEGDNQVLELNPGLCLLTRHLLEFNINKLILYEVSPLFKESIIRLQEEYAQKIDFKIADLNDIGLIEYRDNQDDGSRIKETFGNLTSHTLKIVGTMPGLKLMRYLIKSIVTLNKEDILGKPDMYVVMFPNDYMYLTERESGKHKPVPAMFHLLFDYKSILKVPRKDFIPWDNITTKKEPIDKDYLYLVNIKRKDTLPCKKEHLQLLWFFFQKNTVGTHLRVIPSLEQWIPGCGVWLITGQDPPNTNKTLSPTEHDAKLPHMTIFTEFGDLTTEQKLTIFKRFISWPEFELSSFETMMEKMTSDAMVFSQDDSGKDDATVEDKHEIESHGHISY